MSRTNFNQSSTAGRTESSPGARKRNGGLSVENDFMLITDERVTKLLIKIVEKSSSYFEDNVPNLGDYSTHTMTIK